MTKLGDSVIEEAMMATSLMDDELIGGTYDYADMASFSANLCDVVQDDEDMGGMYGASDETEVYTNRSKRLMCKRCGKAFKNKVLLKRHAALHTKESIFECEECFKKFNRKESLTRHMLVHSGMKFFECQECGRMFNQNGHLRTHMLVHTKEKNFECDKCNMKFARKDNLKRHSLLHNRRRIYECTLCLKRFNQSGHLESHMLVHTQEKNYECQQCLMKFARRDTLKRHMLVHTKEKTFECDYCYARFIQNSHLKAHILVHTREKKFRCPDCDKKFARKGSLKRHMLVHTGERNFECSDCGKTFIQKTHMKKHQLTHKGGTQEKASDDRPDDFIENIHKVEVHIEHESPSKGSNHITKSVVGAKANTLVKNAASASKKLSVSSKIAESQNNESCTSKHSQPSSYSKASGSSASVQVVQHNTQPAITHMPHYSVQTPCMGGDTAATKIASNNQNLPPGVQVQDVSQMQPNNLLANSNSVMALALLDHFLTGNESQENVVVPPEAAAAAAAAAAKAKGGNQWAQKTQQELLAAQTLSAIGQRTTVVNENPQQHYVQGGFVAPQMPPSCNMQPIPQGLVASGPTTMKIRPPTNAEWMSQDKVIMHHQNVVYNMPPPAHEIFRYYSPANVPLHHPSHPPHHKDMGQYKDGIPRLPDGSLLAADMRASPRKPKYPQKVVVPVGEWQTLQMPPSSIGTNMPMYAHAKHPSELQRLPDKP